MLVIQKQSVIGICKELQKSGIHPGRKNNKVRAIAMYLARYLSGVSGKGPDAFFDGISGAAITMKYNQINAELVRNKKLRDQIATLKRQLLNI